MHRQRNKRGGELAHQSDYTAVCIGRSPRAREIEDFTSVHCEKKEEEEMYENKNHRNGKLSAGDSGDK